jgi:hypothetical protein
MWTSGEDYLWNASAAYIIFVRRGFGIAAGHVELNALVKQIQTN